MGAVPSQQEQDRIIEQLGVLCRQCGPERFLNADLLRPCAADFPDPWSATASGVQLLAYRMLKHVHLHPLRVSVRLYDQSDRGGPHLGAPAWFSGIEENALGRKTAVFGVHRDTMVDPQRLVATMAHEVSHSFRRFHRIEILPQEDEEQLTDLTTIYLGFGILTTNASLLIRHSDQGRTTSRSGYVAPQALAFALAVQVVSRGWSTIRRRNLTQWLERDQRVYFKRSLKLLSGQTRTLRGRLGVQNDEAR